MRNIIHVWPTKTEKFSTIILKFTRDLSITDSELIAYVELNEYSVNGC